MFYRKRVIHLVLQGLAVLLIFRFNPVQARPQTYRDRWQQPQRILDSLDVKPGMLIGEIGAGQGYFTFKLALRTGPEGHVYANDINRSGLDAINRKCRRQGISHVTTVMGQEDDPLFPEAVDLLIMVYVFHELQQPLEFLSSLPVYLKPGGRLAFVCWQAPQQNPWVLVPMAAVAPLLPLPPPPGPVDHAIVAIVDAVEEWSR